jgi:A/G-specific adenine glycosylase
VIKNNFFVKWFEANGRYFPWREEGTTPYQFLVTEMLLRQTRASNVAKMWGEFFTDYPNFSALLNEHIEFLTVKIKMLGFANQRAEALQSAARWLIDKHSGIVPTKINELLAIPHIGNYSARAILCFAFNHNVEIVDTNVIRLFSRYFGILLKPDIRRAPEAWEIAHNLLPKNKSKAKAHNYGLLDFTAQICKSGTPRCEICPLQVSCVWGNFKLNQLKQK